MSTKLKILYPAGSFYPAQNGGPDNTVYWITKAMYRRGYHPIISTSDKGQPASTPLNTWIDTEYGEAIYSPDAIHYMPIKAIWRTLSRLREADVLHLTMITYPASFISAILNSIFYGKPMMWSSRGDLDPPMLLRSRRIKATAIWLINTFVKKRLTLFHSTCAEETGYIRDVFGQDANIVEIPNFMELPTKLNLPRQEYLLFVGRIDPKKGIENLLEALAGSKLFRESTRKLKIVGNHLNPYGKSLEALAKRLGLKDRVEFLGHVAGQDKERLLAQAAFLVMPSHTENFGIVVTEALAQGTPAIASTGTPWKILETANAGLWTDNDPKSLRLAIEKLLLQSKDELEAMGKNAERLANDEFDIHQNAAAWEQAYLRSKALAG